MSERLFLHVKLQSGLLLSGGASGAFNSACVRRDGQPYLPASALKGALREQAQRLCGETRAKELFGEEGSGPQGPAGRQMAIPGLRLSDGELFGEASREAFDAGAGWGARPLVAIDRRRRRAAEGMLTVREIVAPFADVAFLARLELGKLTEEQRSQLPGLVAAVFALGAGRSGGLGAIECTLYAEKELLEAFGDDALAALARLERTEVPGLPEVAEVELVFEALEPLCLGGERILGNFRPTLGHVPASALRGAIVTSLAEALAAEKGELAPSTAQKYFLDPATALRLGDAWPCSPSSGKAVAPPPFTTLTCKKHGREHGEVDQLLRAYLLSLLEEARIYVAPSLRCPICTGRLQPAAREGVGTLRRVVSRVGIDRRLAKAAEEQLFSVETLDRGSRFRARIGGLDEESRALLAKALARGLRVGHGRAQGYGRLALVEAEPAGEGEGSLEARLGAFDVTCREQLEELAGELPASPVRPGSYFSVTLTSDLAPEPSLSQDLGSEEALLATLGLPASPQILAGEVRSGRRGGWDERQGWHKRQRAVFLAGSVLLLHSALPLAELFQALAKIEERGAGEGREEGLGWARFSLPAHHPQWRKS